MAFISTILGAELTNWIGKLLLLLHEAVGSSFGWTVIVFTVILKLILSPLDIWQRSAMRKQSTAMAKLQPKMEKLQKQYANRPDLLKQKQYELQKGAHINVLASCLPMIVTMVIFFVVFGGFRALITYENQAIVEELDGIYAENEPRVLEEKMTGDEFSTLLSGYFDGTTDDAALKGAMTPYFYAGTAAADESGNVKLTEAQFDEMLVAYRAGTTSKEEVSAALRRAYDGKLSEEEFNNILADSYKLESWLWVKNVYMADIGTNVVPDAEAFTKAGIGGINATLPSGLYQNDYNKLVGPAMAKYNKQSFWDAKNWNGYFVLPIITIAMSFLSTWIMQKTNPQTATGDAQQQKTQKTTMKIMNYMMPLMLGIFAILYSAAFAIYYFFSNLLSTLLSLLMTFIFKMRDKKAAETQN